MKQKIRGIAPLFKVGGALAPAFPMPLTASVWYVISSLLYLQGYDISLSLVYHCAANTGWLKKLWSQNAKTGVTRLLT